MLDTVVRFDEAQKKRLMVGHDFYRKPVQPFAVLETRINHPSEEISTQLLHYLRMCLAQDLIGRSVLAKIGVACTTTSSSPLSLLRRLKS
jgi:hypothetical protein